MKKTSALIIFASLFVTIHFTFADTWPLMQKIIASDGAVNDHFGYSVAIDGDYAIVGSYMNDELGYQSGSAYIYYWNGTSWTQQAKLTASDGAPVDFFGYSVAISGSIAIVGAHADDDNGEASGSAYIFVRIGTTWTQQTKLIASDGAAGDWFGCSVAIDGDYAIVGAYTDDDTGSNSGSAYIFVRGFTGWSQQYKLLAADGAAGEEFGNSVSISGDFAIVGANKDNDMGNYSGSAYVFIRNDTTWAQMQKFLAPDGAIEDRFGYSVSINGDYAIVGAAWDDDWGDSSGSAYIFVRSGKSWSQQQKIVPSDGNVGATFGMSVALSGDYAVVGASGDDNNGSAYIYKTNGTTWIRQTKLLASDGANNDDFGYSVSISGDYIIAGAYQDDDNGSNSGSAYLFGFAPDADLNDDFAVDLSDFAIFAQWWLWETGM